jgi:Leucine-rich repeat (LRR) protein
MPLLGRRKTQQVVPGLGGVQPKKRKVGSEASEHDQERALVDLDDLIKGEIALVYRTDGRWTYALLKKRSRKGLQFVVHSDGSPKLIRPSWYSTMVRYLPPESAAGEVRTMGDEASEEDQVVAQIDVASINSISAHDMAMVRDGGKWKYAKCIEWAAHGGYRFMVDKKRGPEIFDEVCSLPPLDSNVKNVKKLERKEFDRLKQEHMQTAAAKEDWWSGSGYPSTMCVNVTQASPSGVDKVESAVEFMKAHLWRQELEPTEPVKMRLGQGVWVQGAIVENQNEAIFGSTARFVKFSGVLLSLAHTHAERALVEWMEAKARVGTLPEGEEEGEEEEKGQSAVFEVSGQALPCKLLQCASKGGGSDDKIVTIRVLSPIPSNSSFAVSIQVQVSQHEQGVRVEMLRSTRPVPRELMADRGLLLLGGACCGKTNVLRQYVRGVAHDNQRLQKEAAAAATAAAKAAAIKAAKENAAREAAMKAAEEAAAKAKVDKKAGRKASVGKTVDEEEVSEGGEEGNVEKEAAEEASTTIPPPPPLLLAAIIVPLTDLEAIMSQYDQKQCKDVDLLRSYLVAHLDSSRAQMLLQMRQQRRLAVLLDGLDAVIDSPRYVELEEYITTTLSLEASVCITGRDNSILRDSFGFFVSVSIAPLDTHQQKWLVERRFKGDLQLDTTSLSNGAAGLLFSERVAAFTRLLQNNPPLLELARNPMSLQLLLRYYHAEEEQRVLELVATAKLDDDQHEGAPLSNELDANHFRQGAKHRVGAWLHQWALERLIGHGRLVDAWVEAETGIEEVEVGRKSNNVSDATMVSASEPQAIVEATAGPLSKLAFECQIHKGLQTRFFPVETLELAHRHDRCKLFAEDSRPKRGGGSRGVCIHHTFFQEVLAAQHLADTILGTRSVSVCKRLVAGGCKAGVAGVEWLLSSDRYQSVVRMAAELLPVVHTQTQAELGMRKDEYARCFLGLEALPRFDDDAEDAGDGKQQQEDTANTKPLAIRVQQHLDTRESALAFFCLVGFLRQSKAANASGVSLQLANSGLNMGALQGWHCALQLWPESEGKGVRELEKNKGVGSPVSKRRSLLDTLADQEAERIALAKHQAEEAFMSLYPPSQEAEVRSIDVSNNNIGAKGAQILHELMEGYSQLTSVNMLGNGIGVAQAGFMTKMMVDDIERAAELQKEMESRLLGAAFPPKRENKAVLTTLCGLGGTEEKADFSVQGLTAGCAVLIAAELAHGMLGARITTLDLSGNKIGGEGVIALAAAIAGAEDTMHHNEESEEEEEEEEEEEGGGKTEMAKEAGVLLPSIGGGGGAATGGSWTEQQQPTPVADGEAKVLALPPPSTDKEAVAAEEGGSWAETRGKAGEETQRQAAVKAKAATRKRAKGKLKRMRTKMALVTEQARAKGEAARAVPLLSTLILADCNAGEYIMPHGWTSFEGSFMHSESGEFRNTPPAGTKQAGLATLMRAVTTNTTLTALDLSNNELGTKEAGAAISAMLRRNKTLLSLELASNVQYSNGANDGANRRRIISAIEPLAFIEEIAAAMSRGERGNSTLQHLGLANNRMLSKEGGRIFSEMFRRRQQPRAIRLLDVSRNGWEISEEAAAVEATKEIAVAQGPEFEEDMHLMLMPGGVEASGPAWASRGNSNKMKEEQLAKKRFKDLLAEAQPDGVKQDAAGFAHAFSAGLKMTRALTSVNVTRNNFGPDVAKDYCKVAQQHPNVRSLCGSLGTERQWDFKGRCFGVDDTIMLGQDVKVNKTLTELDLSDNFVGGEQRWMGVGSKELMKHKIGCSYGVGDSFVWDQHKVFVIAAHEAGEGDDGPSERTLDLEYHDLRGIIAIGNAIRVCKRLRKMDMSGNRIDERGKVVVAGAMFVQERLRFLKCDEWGVSENTTELNVSNLGLVGEDVTLLAALIRNNRRLTSINVLQNHIGLEGLQTIRQTVEDSDWLRSVCGAAGESELDLSGLEMDDQDGDLVSIELSRNESLTSVCLLRSSINRHGLEAIQSNSRFRSVCGVSAGQVELHLAHERLELRDARLVSIELGKNLTLTKLDLSGNHFEEAGKAMIGRALLDSRVQYMTTDHFVLDEHTRILDLATGSMGAPEEKVPTVDPTQSADPLEHDPFHHRRTSMLLPGAGPMSPADAMLLFGALRSNRVVTKLAISGNECLDAGSGKVLGQAIKHNYTLTKIDISKNYAHDSGGFAEGFALGLHENTSITELNVAGNSLGFWGGRYLSEGIKACSSVKKLTFSGDSYYKSHWLEGGWAEAPPITVKRQIVTADLSDKKLGPGGCMAFLGFVGKCPNLVSINLMDNRIGTKAAAEAVKVFKSTPTLQSICGLQETFSGHRRQIELMNREEGIDAGDALLIVGELEDNPSVMSINLTDTDVSEIYMAKIRFACITVSFLCVSTLTRSGSKSVF